MAKSGTGTLGKSWGTLGGNGKMHPFTGSGTQKPSQSAQEGSGGRRDQKAPTGGSHGFYSAGPGGKSRAGTQTPGQTSAMPKDGGGKFAAGGSTKMFGNRGSQRAEGGKSSQ